MRLDSLYRRIGELKTLEYAATSKAKAEKKNCKTGYPCGYGCISKTKNCKSPIGKQASSYADWMSGQAARANTKVGSGPKVKTEKTPKNKEGTAQKKPQTNELAFPSSLSKLKTIKKLGGSTGAYLVQDPETGMQYVRKRGANADHLREEEFANDAYRALGVAVPKSKIYETPKGPVKLAEYIEGQSLGSALADPKIADKVRSELKKNFAADALLGNWDVVGMGLDNVLVDKSGKVYRIDNGGSLRFRARGAAKGNAWNENPTELNTLRDPKVNRQTAEIFGDLADKDIATQIKDIAKKENRLLAALPSELRATVKARLEKMQDMVADTARPSSKAKAKASTR